ncbi:M4 family metallopeptidase [Archangium lansingense]|uniref:M4 family metallopeptidase n=1 Tax=Archangium lansingense TaxID=2995310 RepID=A0ABT4AG73_9BACT|nr:M4 family metallopeptidase [Archangium lansinium]MCY1080686.1 M4 family metallopeptidase [Archangium lansinium]
MRHRLLVVCLSFSLAACGETETPGPSQDERTPPFDTGTPEDVRSALPSAEILGAYDDGVPFMIRGDLGSAGGTVQGLTANEAQARVAPVLDSVAPVFRLRASDLVMKRTSRDEQGHTHIRYAQTREGLPVFGHELILHVDASGRVYAANGSARDGESVPAPSQARMTPEALQRVALESTPGGIRVEGEPRLLYARSTQDQRLKLAYEVVVTGDYLGTPVRDHVFLDAIDGSFLLRDSDIHNALNRKVYSANTGGSLPGTLRRSEGGAATADPVVNKAYDNLGVVYSCYRSLFNRDSYNNAGALLSTTVHYGNNYVNAYWNGTQMVCGDGDGVLTNPLCDDLDIIAHEVTHALTESESNLTYSGESGGLNESMSDITAAYCESWSNAWSVGADVWTIGEDIWTPAIPGDGARYLDDPAKTGALDYYTNPLPGDVYELSGISNLAFTLMTKGGMHPRGKSTINVTGLGPQKAGFIFYKANTDFFTPSTTFAQAKTYTEQAAGTLYGAGSAEQAAVTTAWMAVGVGVASPPPPCTTPIALTNGAVISGLAGTANSDSCTYTLAVPVGATNLKVETLGGIGDVDLYVGFGATPSPSSYNCRPYLSGSNESCTFSAPGTGTYSIVLRGFSAYAGVTLKVSYTAPSGSYFNLSGATGSQQLFTYPVAAGQAVTFTLAPNAGGSTGDADLYVRFGSAPTLAAYDCKTSLSGSNERCTVTAPAAGTYSVMVYGYSAYTGVDLSSR